MLSLQTSHVSSYGSSSSQDPILQSSYDFAPDYNLTTWPPVGAYPSPPLSSSPTTTTQYLSHEDKMFADPRMRTQQHELQYWPGAAPSYPQNLYTQHHQQQPQQHQLASIPAHARSPRSHAAYQQQQSYSLPQPSQYPSYAEAQQAREYVPSSNGAFQQPMAGFLAQPNLIQASGAPRGGVTKTIRRTKQHVQTACFNCKKAHLSCDVGRPCNRCKQSGKADTCFNVVHKRRGRPRLRDPFGNKIIRDAPAGNATATNISNTANTAARRTSDPTHVLKSNKESLPVSASFPGPSPTSNGVYSGAPGQPFTFPANNYDQKANAQPIAFLDLDLNIARGNSIFHSVFEGSERRGKALHQLIDSNDYSKLHELRAFLHREKADRQPTGLPPLRVGGVDDAKNIPAVETSDISLMSQGHEKSELLRFVLPNGVCTLRITLRLARQGETFFGILVLPPVQSSPGFQQQQQQAQAPPLMSTSSPAYYGNSYPMHNTSFPGAGPMSAPARSSVSTSTPVSPYYTLSSGQHAMSGATPPQLPSNRSSYDPALYVQQHPQQMYSYTTQAGVTSQANGIATEPRNFSAYQHEPPQLVHYQGQGPPQLVHQQGDHQLPPLSAQYMRPQQQHPQQQHNYFHDASQHVDLAQQGQTAQGKGARSDLQHILE